MEVEKRSFSYFYTFSIFNCETKLTGECGCANTRLRQSVAVAGVVAADVVKLHSLAVNVLLYCTTHLPAQNEIITD